MLFLNQGDIYCMGKKKKETNNKNKPSQKANTTIYCSFKATEIKVEDVKCSHLFMPIKS